MTFESFAAFVALGRSAGNQRLIVPVAVRLSADLWTPVSAFLALRSPDSHTFLLESVEGGEKLARYSFLGNDPYRVVRATGGRVHIDNRRNIVENDPTGVSSDDDVFSVLRALLKGYLEVKVPGLPRLTGGAVGFLGYEMVRLLERLPDPAEGGLDLPDAVWCFYDLVVAFDHVKHQLVLMASVFIDTDTDLRLAYDAAVQRIVDVENELAKAAIRSPEPVRLMQTTLTSNFPRAAFENAVTRAKEYIREGDIFQVVLSQRFEMPFEGDQFNLYRALRQVNPSPYLFYLDFGEFSLIGSSPEVLVRVEDGRAELLPIAGTRPRGQTPEEDSALEKDLLADPKERAEHLMLVDLGRNDLGRVCEYETVGVDRYGYIEKYSHVMHIVSSVSGKLTAGRDAIDVLSACFPAGTVSGAPKVRAMEIINELEPSRRGVYAGAVGYLDFSGNLDTCIAIRTMLVQGDRIYVQAGAGIVADSNPSLEYEETVNKARALKEAVLVASEGLL